MIFHSKIKVILNIESFTKKFECNQALSDSFSKPILFYLSSEYIFLTTFVKIDFKSNELTYYKLLSDENINLMDEHKLTNNSVHSSFSIGPRGFFNFYSLNPDNPSNTFSFIDLEDLTCKVFSADDIFNGEYEYVNESSGNDYTRPDHFFLGVKNKNIDNYEIYSCSYDLNNKIKLLDVPERRYSPHDIKSFKQYLFSTEFFDQRFKTNKGLFNTSIDLYNTFPKFKTIIPPIKPYLLYEINKAKENIQELDGKVLIYDLEKNNNEFNFLNTNFCPAHIEVIDNNMYISSHNFTMMGNYIIYLNPASIDLYKFENETPVFVKKFIDPTGYRYTSHKAFKKNNHPYIATIGHPNRLFIVDGISMEKIKEIDLGGENLFDNSDNIKNFLNQSDRFDNYDPLRFSTVENSDNGEFLIFWDDVNVNSINLNTYEIEQIVNFSTEGFKQKTFHSTRL